MPSNYPVSIDNSTSLPVGSTSQSLATGHIDNHTNSRDAIIAIETKLGVDGSAVPTTLDYLVKNSSSVNPGHLHTIDGIQATGTRDGTTFLSGDGTFKQPPTLSDASTSVKGVSRLSVAPVLAGTPIAVGDNDPRMIPYATNVGVTATVTIATPGVVTFNGHGLVAGDTVQFTTTGALPTGIVANTTYFVIATGLTANNFQISATLNGSAINTTGTQSGVHTLFRSNVYVVTTTPGFTSLANGITFEFRARMSNTTTSPTIVVDGLSATGIRKLQGTANLAIGDIVANGLVKVTLDNSNFVLLNPVGLITDPSIVQLPAVRTITGIQSLALGLNQADGGILIDTSGTNTSGTSTSQSFAINVGANSNRGLLCFVVVTGIGGSAAVTGATYNGVSMTLLDNVQAGNVNGFNQRMYSFYLNAPATGSNTFAITGTGGQTVRTHFYSIYNVSQTAQPEAKNTTAGNTANLTTVASGAHIFGCGANTNTHITTATGSAVYGGSTGSADSRSFNSGTLLPATVNASVTLSSAVNILLISFAPATVPSVGVFPSSTALSTYSQSQDNYSTFTGFSTGSASAGATATVTISGIVTGLSGLTAGRLYYLADTSGTISLTVGTNTRKCGIALTATTLLITNIW